MPIYVNLNTCNCSFDCSKSYSAFQITILCQKILYWQRQQNSSLIMVILIQYIYTTKYNRHTDGHISDDSNFD